MTPKTKLDTVWFKGSIIKKYIYFSTLFIILSLATTLFFANKVAENRDRYEAHTLIEKALYEVENEKDLLRNYAQIIAKNPKLIDALDKKDRALALAVTVEIVNESKKSSILEDLWFQIHAKDLKVLARSWDLNSYGMSLDGFRKGVMFARENRTSTVAIEAGRKLNIKAIAPAYSGGRLVGFVEVIGEYKNIIDTLKRDEIDFAVYMDKNLLETAIDMRDFYRQGDYILASSSEIYKPFDLLSSEDLDRLKNRRFITKEDYLFSAVEISDYDGRIVGIVVASNQEINTLSGVIMTKSKIEKMTHNNTKLQTINYYENMSLKALVESRSDVPFDERMFYNQAVKKIIADETMLDSLLLEESKTVREVTIR